MGGRTSLNAVARYPDRVEAAISVDAAPVDESYRHRFGSFTLDVVSNFSTNFMLAIIHEHTLVRYKFD